MRRAMVTAAVLLAASACSPDESALVVGAVYPTGGSQGLGGTYEYRGARLAADLVNLEGGVRGRPVRVLFERADAAEAAPRAVERLAGRGVEVILGSYGSTISAPAAETAARRDVVLWETGAVGEMGAGARPGERFFRVAPMGTSLGAAGVRFVEDRLLPLLDSVPDRVRYGVAYVDDVYGRSVGLGALDEIRASGLRLAGAFPYDLARVDFDALARRIAGAGTDVLVVAAYLEDGVELRRAILRERVPLLASIGTSSSYCMPEFGVALGGDAVGLFASDKPDPAYLEPSMLRADAGRALEWAKREYRARFGAEMTAEALSGFAGAWALFRHVLPASDGASAASVADAARRIRLPSGSLPNGSGLRFAPRGDERAGANVLATSVIWEWVRPNTRAVVWPAPLASSPILPLLP